MVECYKVFRKKYLEKSIFLVDEKERFKFTDSHILHVIWKKNYL